MYYYDTVMSSVLCIICYDGLCFCFHLKSQSTQGLIKSSERFSARQHDIARETIQILVPMTVQTFLFIAQEPKARVQCVPSHISHG